MTVFQKPWDMKIKSLAVVTFLFLVVLYIIYFIFLPQDISHVNKTEFLRKKRNHKVKNIEENAINQLMEMSNIGQFKEILKPMLKERVSGTDGNREVQTHIKNFMRNLGWDIFEDKFNDPTPFGQKEFTNIVATHNIDVPRKLTLACHFDSKYFDKIKYIGATDSAVPCAMIMDLAKNLHDLLHQSSTKAHDISLQFVFFDGEEAFVRWTDTDSIYGARHLAKVMQDTKVDVDREVTVNYLQTMDVMVLLDLIGAPDPKFRDFFSNTSPLFKKLQVIEKVLGKSGHLKPVDAFKSKDTNTYFVGGRWGGAIQDDHIPFKDRNVPILHLISSPFPDVWHTERDDESALDYTVIDNLNKILRVFVASYLHLL